MPGEPLNNPPPPEPPAPPGARPPPAAPAKPSKPRRWFRLLRLTLVAGTCVVVGGIVLTQGPVAAWIAEGVIERATGAKADIRWARLTRAGNVVLSGVTLRIPDLPGEEGQFLACSRLDIELDWSAALAGQITPKGVRLLRPFIRISQTRDGGKLALTRLDLGGKGGGGKAVPSIPRIDAIDGAIELGEYQEGRPGTFERLARLEGGGWIAKGTLRPDGAPASPAQPDDPDDYRVELRETAPVTPEGVPIELVGPRPEGATEPGMTLRGGFNLRKQVASAGVTRIALEDWTQERVPRALRDTWRKLAMRGRVSNTRFDYNVAAGGLTASIRLDGVAMNVPVDAERPETTGLGSSAMGPPAPPRWLSMENVGGTIEFSLAGPAAPAPDPLTNGAIRASLSGTVAGLPIKSLNLNTRGLDPDYAGLRCEIICEGFEMRRSSQVLSLAPWLVRRRLEGFCGPEAIVNARTIVERADPTRLDTGEPVPGNVAVSGSVQFSAGKAAFEHFPYPIVDLTGLVTFDEQAVNIVSVRGRGLTGAALLATGSLSPADDPTQADIVVTVTRAPVDEFLAAAMDRRRDLAAAVLSALTPPLIADLREPAGRAKLTEASQAQGGGTLLGAVLGEDLYRALRDGERSWRMGLFDAVFSQDRFKQLVARRALLDPAKAPAMRREVEALREAWLAAAKSGPVEGDLAGQIAALDTHLAAPEFPFGGLIDELTVTVRYGPDTNDFYNTDINVRFRNAGVLPKSFPLPIFADNIKVKVREFEALIEGTGFRGLKGGTADLRGRIDLTDPARTAGVPELSIAATNIPVDDLLIGALPDTAGQGLSAKSVLTALNLDGTVSCTADIRQDDAGDAGFTVEVGLNGLRARPAQRDASRPAPVLSALEGRLTVTERALRLRDFVGHVYATDDPALSTTPPEGPAPADVETAPPAPPPPALLTLSATNTFAEKVSDTPSSLTANVTVRALDTRIGVEDVIAILSPDAAAGVAALRDTYRPTGRLTTEVEITSAAPLPAPLAGLNRPGHTATPPLDVTVTFKDALDLGADALGSRLTVTQHGGTVAVTLLGERTPAQAAAFARPEGPDRSLTLLDGVFEASFDALPAGEFLLTGRLALDRAPSSSSTPATTRLFPIGPLTASITNGRIESPFARRIVLAAASAEVAQFVESSRMRGLFDALVTISPSPDDPQDSDPARWGIVGRFTPLSFGLSRGTTNFDANEVLGAVLFDNTTGRIDALELIGNGWNVRADGDFALGRSAPIAPTPARTPTSPRAWSLDLALSARAQTIDPALLLLLPQAVADSADQIRLDIADGLRIDNARLILTGPPPAASPSPSTPPAPLPPGIDFAGTLAFSGMSADVGATLQSGRGSMGIRVERPAGALTPDGQPLPPVVALALALDSVRAAGVSLTSASASIIAGRRPGEVAVPTLFGDCHGGRLSGAALVRIPDTPANPLPPTAQRRPALPPTRAAYQFQLQAAGVRFADLLADVKAGARITDPEFVGPPAPSPADLLPSPPAPPGAPVDAGPIDAGQAGLAESGDHTRGLLEATIAITGQSGDGGERHGRGALRIAGGDVVSLPLVLPLIQMSNLQLPGAERLDFLRSTFTLDGPTVSFTTLELSSPSVALSGTGTLTLPTFDADLTFNSKSRRRLPLFSDLFEGLRDEIVTTRVTGPLRDPRIGVESFSGLRRVLGSIGGDSPSSTLPPP